MKKNTKQQDNLTTFQFHVSSKINGAGANPNESAPPMYETLNLFRYDRTANANAVTENVRLPS